MQLFIANVVYTVNDKYVLPTICPHLCQILTNLNYFYALAHPVKNLQ